MSWENVACCDDCWEDFGFAAHGRKPLRLKQEVRREEYCHFCGWTTYSGIYVREDTLDRPAATLRIRKEY